MTVARRESRKTNVGKTGATALLVFLAMGCGMPALAQNIVGAALEGAANITGAALGGAAQITGAALGGAAHVTGAALGGAADVTGAALDGAGRVTDEAVRPPERMSRMERLRADRYERRYARGRYARERYAMERRHGRQARDARYDRYERYERDQQYGRSRDARFEADDESRQPRYVRQVMPRDASVPLNRGRQTDVRIDVRMERPR